MKKTLAVIALVIILALSFSSSVFADKGNGNPPVSETGPISLSPPENIGGVLVGVEGTGTLTMHINKPPSGHALEESWFEVTSFTGVVTLNGLPLNVSASNVKVNIHNGTMAHQPIITIRFAEPTPLSIPGILNPGLYSIIQMLGWGNIIHAS